MQKKCFGGGKTAKKRSYTNEVSQLLFGTKITFHIFTDSLSAKSWLSYKALFVTVSNEINIRDPSYK